MRACLIIKIDYQVFDGTCRFLDAGSKDVVSQETHLEDLELEWDEEDKQALNDFLGPSDENKSMETVTGDGTRKDAKALKNEDDKEEEEECEREEDGEVKILEDSDGESEDVISGKLKDGNSEGEEGTEDLKERSDEQSDVPQDEGTAIVKEENAEKANTEVGRLDSSMNLYVG